MASTNAIDHADSSDDSYEHPSSAVSPYSAEELAALVKVTVLVALHTHPLIALQKLQIENADFRAQLRKLTSGASSSAGTNPPSASISSNPLEQHADEFDQFGRSFTVLYEIWPRPAHLSQPFPDNLREIGPWHARRYTNEQTKREAIIAEVYNFVPPHFHKLLEGSPFFANKVRATTAFLKCIYTLMLFSFSLVQNLCDLISSATSAGMLGTSFRSRLIQGRTFLQKVTGALESRTSWTCCETPRGLKLTQGIHLFYTGTV